MSSVPQVVVANVVRNNATGLTIPPAANTVPTADGTGHATWQPSGGGGPAVTLDPAAGATGESIVSDGVGPALTVKGLAAGAGMTVATAGSDVVYTNASPASSVTLDLAAGSTGQSIVTDGVGPALAVKGLAAGVGMTVATVGSDVTFTNASPASSVTLDPAAGATGESIISDGVGPSLAVKGLAAGVGMAVATVGSDVTFTNASPASSVTLASAPGFVGSSLVTDGSGPSLAVKAIAADDASGTKITSTATDVKASAALKMTQGTDVSADNQLAVSQTAHLIPPEVGATIGTATFAANSTAPGTTIRLHSESRGTGSITQSLQATAFINGLNQLFLLPIVDAGQYTSVGVFTIDLLLQIRSGSGIYFSCQSMVQNLSVQPIFRSSAGYIPGFWDEAIANTISLDILAGEGGGVQNLGEFDMRVSHSV